MKKLLALILTGALAFSMVACGEKETVETPVDTNVFTLSEFVEPEVSTHIILPLVVNAVDAEKLTIEAENGDYIWAHEYDSSNGVLSITEAVSEDNKLTLEVKPVASGEAEFKLLGHSMYGIDTYVYTVSVSEDLKGNITVNHTYEEYSIGPVLEEVKDLEKNITTYVGDGLSTWFVDVYTPDIIEINQEFKEDNSVVYTINPLSAGEVELDFLGEDSIAMNIYHYKATVVDVEGKLATNLTLIDKTVIVKEVKTGLEGEFETYTNSVLEALGEGNYPNLESRMLDVTNADEMTYMFGVSELAGLEAASASEPPMSSIAFALHVLKFDTAENANAATATLVENAPMVKWVCVSADEATAKVVGENYVIFAMTTTDNIAKINAM